MEKKHDEHESNIDRELNIDQLSKLLSVVQVMACRLANESHGRSYDKARELNELLHMARLQISVIESESEAEAEVASGRMPIALERRKTPRSSLFGALRSDDK